MTQPPHWQSSEPGPLSTQYGQQTRYGRPQDGQPPADSPLPFYGPGPYPPTPDPTRRSYRNLIIAMVGIVVIAAGAVAAAVLLMGTGGAKKHTAEPAGRSAAHRTTAGGRPATVPSGNPPHRPSAAAEPRGHSAAHRTPLPARPAASPRSNPSHARSAGVLSCPGIKHTLVRFGFVNPGDTTVSDGGTLASISDPLPAGTPTTICSLRGPRSDLFAGATAHAIAIVWRGVSRDAYVAQLKRVGYLGMRYQGLPQRFYKIWINDLGRPKIVTAVIAGHLVTFYHRGPYL